MAVVNHTGTRNTTSPSRGLRVKQEGQNREQEGNREGLSGSGTKLNKAAAAPAFGMNPMRGRGSEVPKLWILAANSNRNPHHAG